MDNTNQPPDLPPPQPINQSGGLQVAPKKRKSGKKWLVWSLLGVVIIIIAAITGGYFWYQRQLDAVTPGSNETINVEIQIGASPEQIGQRLKDEGLIRNAYAFTIYTRLEGVRQSLQAGAYQLSPSQTLPEIVDLLTQGGTQTFTITFIPGSTMAQNRQVLIDTGFSEDEVDQALEAEYTSPLFAGKPAGTDLEGYIYGETYEFKRGAPVAVVLERTFAEFYSAIERKNIIPQLQQQGLSLYEGITLASIVQREITAPNPSEMTVDQQRVAQIFLTRLERDISLGSDVTYQFIADKMNQPRDINFDSPYNTRRYTGLPPGPIATTGIGALEAVARPANTDYLFFVSGDDEQTYYSRTNEEHQRNIDEHCHIKCQII